MKTRLFLPLAFALLVTGIKADNEVYRTWTDTQGRKLEATFRGIENGQVFLQVRNGYVYRLPLDKLSAEDQQAAKTLKPEGLGIPADPNLAQADPAPMRLCWRMRQMQCKPGQKAPPAGQAGIIRSGQRCG